MSRYAKANQTIDDLKACIRKAAERGADGGKLTKYCGGEEHPLWDFFKGDWNVQKTVRDDLAKVEVDFENVDQIGEFEMPGTESLEPYEMIGSGPAAFPVMWCAAGGDWELPLVFVLYIGQKGELRGYIPKDGNAYNFKEKAAYGNNDSDPEFDDDDPRYKFDAAKLREAVAKRIVVSKT